MKKVYALRAENGISRSSVFGTYKIKISSEKMWNEYADALEQHEEVVWQHNNIYYLSLSRKALIQKAKEIKEEWLRELNEKIKEVEEIVIK